MVGETGVLGAPLLSEDCFLVSASEAGEFAEEGVAGRVSGRVMIAIQEKKKVEVGWLRCLFLLSSYAITQRTLYGMEREALIG